MRVAFAGTPEFAAVALRALIAARFDVPLVLTQPDRPAGRGLKLHASPVKQLALQRGIARADAEAQQLFTDLRGRTEDAVNRGREAYYQKQADIEGQLEDISQA